MGEVVYELLATRAALEKLGRRAISGREVQQIPRNRYSIGRNRHGPADRRMLFGRTDGGRALTLVVEATIEPTTWPLITGWESTERERKMLGA